MEKESLPRSILALVLITLVPASFGRLGYRIGKYRRKYSPDYKILRSKINSMLTCFLAGIFFSVVFLHLIPSLRVLSKAIGIYRSFDFICISGEIIIVCVSFFAFCFINDCGFACVSYLHSETYELDETSEEDEDEDKEKKKKEFGGAAFLDRGRRFAVNSMLMKYKSIGCYCCGLPSFFRRKLRHKFRYCKTHIDSITTVVLALEIVLRGVSESLSIGLENDPAFFQLLLAAFLIYKSRLLYKHCMQFRIEGVTSTEFTIYVSTCCSSMTVGVLTGIVVNHTVDESVDNRFMVMYFKAISAGSLMFLSVCELLGRQKNKEKRRFLVFISTFCGFLVGVAYKFMK